jgi:hypothetical protein
MPVPPQLIMAAMQMMKDRKSTKDRIKEALAPSIDVMKNKIAPLVGMGADAGYMYNLRAEDPSMRTGIATGAVGAAAKGFQAGGIGGLLTGGVTGALTGALATGNAKEQKAEQDRYTYLNQMYGSVTGDDHNLQSLLYAEEGGEIVSPEGEVFVPIQTEAKKIGKKLVKEKLIFSDGTIADVNATKPHSQQKKDDVTDIAVEGTYVMPVSTKLSKKDLDSLISYSTSKYSENGKNFAVEKVTLKDILGEKFEGSFAEATDIVTKKYPVMDTDDDLDPIARITNSENIANRSKIIAHLMRLNEAKINKEPIEETKLTPSMKAKTGGYVQKYVLGSTVSGGDPSNPKTALEKRKEKYDQNKPKPVNQYTLKAYEPESKAKKIYKALVAPVSTMDNRANTSYEDPSGLDVALGVVNPFAWIDGAATVLKSTKDIATGEATGSDYGTVGVSAAAAALGLRGSGAKRVGDKISKFMNNMYNPAAGVGLKKVDVPTPTRKKEVLDISDFNKENEYYRVVVGDEAFNDIVQTGTVRTKPPVDKVTNKEGLISLDRRGSTAYPSFSKGKASIEYAKENPNNYIVVTADESIKPSIAGRHGKGTTMFPTSSEGKHLKELAADKVKVYKHMGDGKYELVEHMPTTKKMSKGGFVSQYVLKPKMIAKKGGYIRNMEEGGSVGDPPGKKYTNKSNGATIIVGNDNKTYWKNKDGSYKEAAPQIVDAFKKDMQIKGSANPTGPTNPWVIQSSNSSKTQSNSKEDEWISQILDFETTTGSRSGSGLKNYGIQRDKWGKKYSYLDKDEISKEDAARFIKEEFLPKVKDYPPDVQKRLVDYAYNTGRNIEDVLMHASGLVDTESVQLKNTDYALFDKNKDQIIKNMQDPNFVSKIDQSKHDILKDYWTRKGTPKVYDDTSSKRINMWNPNQRPKVNIEQLPISAIDPINSMETMDILGTPVMRPNVQTSQGAVPENTGAKFGEDYLGKMKINWDNTTLVDGYSDYVKGKTGETTKTLKTGGAKEVGASSNYTPKGAYYIPGENKNRYDQDPDGNWYVQKDDGKTWVSASSLSNSADAIKRLNDEARVRSVTQNDKPATSSLVRPKNSNMVLSAVNVREAQTESINQDPLSYEVNTNSPNYNLQVTDNRGTNNYYDERVNREVSPSRPKTNLQRKKEKYNDNRPNNPIDNRQQTGYGQQLYADRNTWTKEAQEGELAVASSLVPVGLAANAIGKTIVNMPKIGRVMKFGKNYIDKIGNIISPKGKVLVKVDPNQIQSKANKVIVGGPKSKGWDSFFKKKGGYIRKMYAGGPIVPLLPDRWRDIWAIDEKGHEHYYPMPNMINNPDDNNPYQIGVPIGTPRADDVPYEQGKQIGTPRADSQVSSGDEMLNEYKDLISKRKDEATKSAEESKKGYNDLSRRVGMRDLMQLGTGLAGIGLQDRTEKRAFKRPLYIDQKYRGLSAQQINQESEAATGAGVESVKQMMNSGGDRVTARLAPILIDRLITQQGRNKKAYVDQNTALERAKYAERGDIQQSNLNEEARAQNAERDFNNKTIAGSGELINKYISSASAGDIQGYKTEEGINRGLTDKLYKLDDQELQVDMIGKDYDMQMADVKKRIADIEGELTRTDIDAAMKAKLEASKKANEEYLKELEKGKIRNNIR